MDTVNRLIPEMRSITVDDKCEYDYHNSYNSIYGCMHKCTIMWKGRPLPDEQDLYAVAIKAILDKGVRATVQDRRHFFQELSSERQEQLAASGFKLITPPSEPVQSSGCCVIL